MPSTPLTVSEMWYFRTLRSVFWTENLVLVLVLVFASIQRGKKWKTWNNGAAHLSFGRVAESSDCFLRVSTLEAFG